MSSCVSKKKMYLSQALAEDALIDAHVRFGFGSKDGPRSVYKCGDCGQFHLTSRGPTNARLAHDLDSGKIKRDREAGFWRGQFEN
jgi:hypothetical protein